MSEETLFHQALAKSDPQDRAAFLDAACAGKPELRAAVEALLAASERPDDFLNKPAITRPRDAPNTTSVEGPGSLIGPYKLLEHIGDGGFGVVYTAEQKQPIRRTVALKILKPGMDTRQVITRFEAERQALAVMEHANIARVLDGGETDAGRPYFVMELVKGVPITKYCDEHQLTPRERLALFVPVCHAIQHAHHKGIIHRDLKPGNVLIAAYDGRPVPKVIDFGVAKALGQPLTERTLVTGFGGIVGTLEYMSPEQAEFNALDVDTRSDIYSLGVLLYELLTGTTPLTKERIQKAAIAEVLRLIREEEAPRPSTRLSDSNDTLASISAQRKLEPARLTKELRGELDWIVMKCLEKDRNRRYETALGMARDIERYLNDDPVEAGPPAMHYRLRKFLRRNRTPVIAATLVLLALVGGIIGTTVGLVRADRQRARAEAAEINAITQRDKAAESAAAERLAKEASEKRLSQIEKGNQILGSIFENLHPGAEDKEGKPLRALLGNRLGQAAEQLEGEAVGDPLVVARLQRTLASSLIGLGYAKEAVPLLAKTRETFATQLGPADNETIGCNDLLSHAHRQNGDWDLAIAVDEESFKLREETYGRDHRLTLNSMTHVAIGYENVEKLDMAIALLQEGLDRATTHLGPNHQDTLNFMTQLATCYHRTGNRNQAIELGAEAVKRALATLGSENYHTLYHMDALASIYTAAGQPAQSMKLFEEILTTRKALLGLDHYETVNTMGNLGLAYVEANKAELAVPLFEDSLRLTKARFGPQHESTLVAMNNLAYGYQATGRAALALPILEEALQVLNSKLGPEHRTTLIAMNNLANAYESNGNMNRALELKRAAATGIEHLDFQHAYSGRIIENLSLLLENERLFDEAEAWRRKWLVVLKTQGETDSTTYAGQLAGLGYNLLQQARWTEAEPNLREALAIRQRDEPDAWRTYNTRSLLGAALLGQKRYAEAEPYLVQGYEGLQQREDTVPKVGRYVITNAIKRLVQLYEELGEPDKAAPWQSKLTEQVEAEQK